MLSRAGGRCEHHSALTGRCRTTTDLEADHVHPHSRGGRTNLTNGQALCRRHNRRKHARVPYAWQLNQLARRRGSYYPQGVPGVTTRPAGVSRTDSRELAALERPFDYHRAVKREPARIDPLAQRVFIPRACVNGHRLRGTQHFDLGFRHCRCHTALSFSSITNPHPKVGHYMFRCHACGEISFDTKCVAAT